MNNNNTNLSQYFPIIRTREAILEEINSKRNLKITYDNWTAEQKERFLDMCTGAIGVKMLYDGYFKGVFNPEIAPDRLSDLLSCILGKRVTVKYALPNDNSRLGDEMSLVITDIVVELEDGSIANIEVQKLGYLFTGERASCYSADLLLRQYLRVRDKMKKEFSYKDIAPVYTIVFLEESPAVFHKFPDNYVHTFTTTSDTGLSLNMLQNFVFVPIDIFLRKLHNEGVSGELEAWLTFLGCDEPDYIISLIEKYPYFKPLYEDLYEMCINTEDAMALFSKELQILDRNTVTYMIEQYKEELDEAKTTIAEKDKALNEKDAYIAELEAKLAEKDKK